MSTEQLHLPHTHTHTEMFCCPRLRAALGQVHESYQQGAWRRFEMRVRSKTALDYCWSYGYYTVKGITLFTATSYIGVHQEIAQISGRSVSWSSGNVDQSPGVS